MLSVSFLVRVLLFAVQGFQADIGTFGAWFNIANEQGGSFYTSLWSNPQTAWVDYPPFNVYIFWVFGSLTKVLTPIGVSWVNIVKLVPNLFDMAIGAVIYFFVRKQLSFKLSLITVALYVFNPAIVFNAAVWGQFDAIYTFFLLISLLLAIKSKPELSAVTFALAILTKAQGIALLPLVVFLILKQNGVKRFLTAVLAFAATIFLVILPLDWGGSPVTFLSRLYFGIYGHYTYTSFNAFNLWGLFGFAITDENFFILGWVLFGALSLFTLYVLNKRFKVSDEMPTLFAAFMLFFGFFMLLTRMHERYMFPAISILVLMFPFVKKTRTFYFVLTGTLLANIAYVLYWLNLYANAGYDYGPNLTGHPVVLAVGVINLIMLVYAIILLWDELKGRHWLKKAPELNQTQKRGEQDEPKTEN
jgi:Gpi18-like mannosyltransferase